VPPCGTHKRLVLVRHKLQLVNSVTSLYGRFRAEKLPYKEVTEIWGLMQCCKDLQNPVP